MFRDPSTAAPARWRRRANRARERRTRGGGARSLGEPQTQVRRGEKCLDEISFPLDRLAAALLAIHHRHHTEHVPSLALHRARSEEHTSELQSLAYLVCRLLLEKKKKDGKLSDRHSSRTD